MERDGKDPAGRRLANAMSTAVAVAFVALWTAAALSSPEGPHPVKHVVTMWVLTAPPFVLGSWLLVHAWRRRAAAAGRSTVDGPARVLGAAVRALPRDRRDWGAAMAAELAEVPGRRERWRFVAGCVRVAAWPPRSRRRPAIAVGAGSTVVVLAVALATGEALPALRVFAVTFAALAGALATLTVARSGRAGLAGPGRAVFTIGLVGVAGCIAVTGYIVVGHSVALAPVTAVVLAAGLVACLWLTVTQPLGLAGNRLARRLGVGAAVVLAAGFLLSARYPAGDANPGVLVYLFAAPIVLVPVTAAVTAGLGRSLRTGVAATVWTAVLATLLVFAIQVPEAVRWYQMDGRLLVDADPASSLGTTLSDAIFLLFALPIWVMPFGVIGAALGDAFQQGWHGARDWPGHRGWPGPDEVGPPPEGRIAN